MQPLGNRTPVYGLIWAILGDPGADSRGREQITRAKSVQAEAWCERKLQDGREQPLRGYL